MAGGVAPEENAALREVIEASPDKGSRKYDL